MEFQFYSSAIKTVLFVVFVISVSRFQFYSSAIKTRLVQEPIS